mmetsp:Transcript_45699/g.74246  ORF Transcript_45699/g.74246 Transcript_45699/m.74246 type:complete len:214 (-) Transcript_45699:66-707(-)
MEQLHVTGLRGLPGYSPMQSPAIQSVSEGSAEEEDDEGRTDLAGLLEFLDSLANRGFRLVEINHIANSWALGGLIPMTHHGFVIKTSAQEYFSLDFSRTGIVWDLYGDEPPDMPDNTVFAEMYMINVDPRVVQRYCAETKPFQWLQNDCDTWSRGLLQAIGATSQEREVQHLCGFGGQAQDSSSFCAGSSVETVKPIRIQAQPGRRQRTGDCL